MPYLGLHFSVKSKRFSIKVAEDNYIPTVLVVFLLSFVMPHVSSIPLAGIWLGAKMLRCKRIQNWNDLAD